MKLFLTLFIFCVFGASCDNGNKIKIPKDILCQDTMVEVITDVHLVQAAQRMSMVIDTADTGAFTSFNYVWKKHNLTEAQYKKNLDFYTHNPAILDSIYEKVLNNLSKQKAVLQGKLNPKKH
jgi:hypothetical protein